MTRRETTAAPITHQAQLHSVRRPARSSEDHDDRACPLTRTPGVIQRGRFAPRRKRPDFVDVPLDEDGPWDTGGSLFNVDGWPERP